ncbi:MAG: glycosyltransferase family protein [Patescibacteria group bacterium]
MRIIYGVSGEGLGHIFEAIEIVDSLRKAGHEVKVLTYGERALKILEPYSPIKIEGIELKFTAKGLSLLDTFFGNLKIFSFYFKNYKNIKSKILYFKPDVFITAYEPFTTFISHVVDKPLISMDNQSEFLYINYPADLNFFDYILVKWATKICTYKATYHIIKSFNKIPMINKNIFFVDPIIQAETVRSISVTGEHILVYLTKENIKLISILKTIPERFIVYCNNKKGVDENITYRTIGPSYLEDLRTCKAIIGTTGFSLIADSIFLKKPFLGVPLKKQFEQMYNATFLQKSGIGIYIINEKREEIISFLNNLQKYRQKLMSFDYDAIEQQLTLLNIIDLIHKK